jgi:hypothetical protein
MEKMMIVSGFGSTQEYLVKPVLSNLNGSINFYTLEPKRKLKEVHLLLELDNDFDNLNKKYISLPVNDRISSSNMPIDPTLPMYIHTESDKKISSSLGNWTYNVNSENPLVKKLKYSRDIKSRDLSELLLKFGENNFREFFTDMVKFGESKLEKIRFL